MSWYSKHPEEALSELRSNLVTGLSSAEAATRLATHGANVLEEATTRSPLVLLALQFKNPLIIILLFGAAVSFATGHSIDAIAISVIVLINAGISFSQEWKAERSLASLKEMAAPTSVVLRNSEWTGVPSRDLVPGDIVKINTGDIVGADLRLAEVNRLQIDEAPLTGESVPVEKTTAPIIARKTQAGDQTNMAFMSTVVTGGNGIGVVADTAMKTEIGQIAGLINNAEDVKTPLQRRLESLSKTLMGAAFLVVAIVIAIGIHHGMDLVEMLNTGISLSVAAIPEGLPTVVTIVLTLGFQRMAKNNALARKLAAVETLGSTSVICSDKTGTLTQNQMQVTHICTGGPILKVGGLGFDPKGTFSTDGGVPVNPSATPALERFLVASALANDAVLAEKKGVFTIQGNPTEGALVVVAAKAGIHRKDLLASEYEIVRSFPFDSTRKMMSVIVRDPDGHLTLLAKGAPDVILSRSVAAEWDDAIRDLDPALTDRIEAVIEDFGTQALRTLAVARRPVSQGEIELGEDLLERDLTFLGIHGIIDPPRPEVIDSVTECWSAGVRTVMITGDHAATAEAIAHRIGIIRSEEDLVMTGARLSDLSDSELEEQVEHIAVFARVSPKHKLRIVKALQSRGYVTAMTGDGVNDAPALRSADIGIAMGISGTQVAKDSAALILLDDNFSTIVTAVRDGRRIYDNIRKFIRQELTANVGEVSAILFAFLMSGGDPILPLTALMILWINLVSDGLPALALGLDNAEPGLMARQPRSRDESFFAGQLAQRIIIRGLALGWLTYFLFSFARQKGAELPYAQTVAFATLIFAQLFHVFDCRSFKSIYDRNPFGNRYLLVAVTLSATFSLLVIYTAFGNLIFGTVPLTGRHLAMIIAFSSLPTLLLSAMKILFRIKWL